eukprot:6204547-Pleurochrysis_carterae.AAC.2
MFRNVSGFCCQLRCMLALVLCNIYSQTNLYFTFTNNNAYASTSAEYYSTLCRAFASRGEILHFGLEAEAVYTAILTKAKFSILGWRQKQSILQY